MSGYREHHIDGNASYDTRPARPFSWFQWLGVAFMVGAIAIDLAFVAGQFGWTRKLLTTPMPGVALIVAGVTLVNSRRQPMADPAPELAAERRRLLVIVTAICAVILGVATIFAMKGY